VLQIEGESRPSLLVSEIFSSVQGEGTNLGTPSVFLRLGICNLHCWYCDTKYTWLYNEKMLRTVKDDLRRLGVEESSFPQDLKIYDQSKETEQDPVNDVAKRIREFGIDHLVVTGGEPVLQQAQLVQLLQLLKTNDKKRGFYVEIETNGTIKPVNEILPFVDQWNISPKLESSGNSKFAREKDDALKSFATMSNSFFKFVVSQERFEADLLEIESISFQFGIDPGKIILMAEGTDASILRDRTASLSKICEKRGYRVTPRLHILLWGNKRGA
jgi:7-carboxy-7-deazaguanine synthase